MNSLEEDFRCPLCFEHILIFEINEHIQRCGFYPAETSESYSDSEIDQDVNGDAFHNFSQISNSNIDDSSQNGSHSEGDRSYNTFQEVQSPKALSENGSVTNPHSVASCPICCNHYQYSANVPLLLPACGHTICGTCLKNIKEHNILTICPICRKISKDDLKTLPINYALLELCQLKKQKKCEIHALEIIAYCKDDENILCGACILDHKNHKCVLLTDESLLDISRKKKEEAKKNIGELINNQIKWRKSYEKFEKIWKEIKNCAEIHQEGVKDMGKKMRLEVSEGSFICNYLIENIEEKTILNEKIEVYRINIGKIQKKIQEIQEKLLCFEELEMTEKLLIKKHEIESIEASNETFEKLGFQMSAFEKKIDYKDSISKKKLI